MVLAWHMVGHAQHLVGHGWQCAAVHVNATAFSRGPEIPFHLCRPHWIVMDTGAQISLGDW